MKKLILALVLVLFASPALAQNPTCPTRPSGDSTNACASTAFVQTAVQGSTTYTCTGTGDVSAINAAISVANLSGGGDVLVRGVNCAGGGSSITLLSNVYLRGQGPGATVITLGSSFSGYIITASGQSHFGVSDITIDAGDFDGGASSGAINFTNSTDWVIERIEVKKMGRFGLLYNGAVRYWLINNIINKTTASTAQNQGILGACSLVNLDGHVNGNTLLRTAIDICDGNTEIVGNYVDGWKFGAGITTEQNANCFGLKISYNTTINGGPGPDDNGYTPGGIENWCRNSSGLGNYIYNNGGTGLDQGGARNNWADNSVFDNSQRGAGLFPGISCRYGDATYNCNGSRFSSNQSYNTAGASGNQTYGYSEESANVANITLTGNNLATNRTGAINILGPSTSVGLNAILLVNNGIYKLQTSSPGLTTPSLMTDDGTEVVTAKAGAVFGSLIDTTGPVKLTYFCAQSLTACGIYSVTNHPVNFGVFNDSTNGFTLETNHSTTFKGIYIKINATTVAGLPSCTGLAGSRATVTDSNATLTAGIGAVVAGGGAITVPVVCDGTSWRIG